LLFNVTWSWNPSSERTKVRDMTRIEKQLDGESKTPSSAASVIHLPALISDEFGTPRSNARKQIAEGYVEVDGKRLNEETKFDLNVDDILDKKITVVGPNNQYQMIYRG